MEIYKNHHHSKSRIIYNKENYSNKTMNCSKLHRVSSRIFTEIHKKNSLVGSSQLLKLKHLINDLPLMSQKGTIASVRTPKGSKIEVSWMLHNETQNNRT